MFLTFNSPLYAKENRCDARCKKSKLRCLLNKGHGCRHKFTPPNLLSPSTINKIILQLTSGEIQAKAGLDGTYIAKGYENFQNMKSFVTTLAGIIQGEEAEKTKKALIDRIKWLEEYHTVDFIYHLGKGTSKCTCVKCGFYDEKVDPIKCDCDHTPPCGDCQKAFNVSAFIQSFFVTFSFILLNVALLFLLFFRFLLTCMHFTRKPRLQHSDCIWMNHHF